MSTRIVQEVYRLLANLPRHDYRTLQGLPVYGVYAFYERGETVILDGEPTDRIVRVGTTKSRCLLDRIQEHYCRTSIFRREVCCAMLARDDPKDPLLSDYPELADLRSELRKDTPLKRRLDAQMQKEFSFVCFPVKSESSRVALEAGLTALLSQHPLGSPSPGWLGRFSPRQDIRERGLWQSTYLDSTPLSQHELSIVRNAVEGS